MQTLADEIPYAAVISNQFVDNYCAFCIKKLDSNSACLACDDCVDVCYCSIKCQRNDWKKVHQLECQVLKNQNGPIVLTPLMRLCLRVMIQKFKTCPDSEISFNGASLDDLETNFEELQSSSDHQLFLADLMMIIQESSESFFDGTNRKQIIPIISAILCNSFSITDEFLGESIGSALYIGIAKHNHSCSSGNHVVFHNNRAILRSPVGWSYSKNLTIPYVSRMLPTHLRQKSIFKVHFFTCLCEMCKDEEKDSIGMSRRCSTKDCDGYCKTLSFQENEQNPCIKCGNLPKIGTSETYQATSKLLDHLENLHKENDFSDDDYSKQFKLLISLRSQYSQVLSDFHVAILQLDEQIAFCLNQMPKFKLPSNFEQLAVRGCQQYVDRLSIGTPEVTRRLYLACICLLKSENKNSVENQNLFKNALKSSELSHGKHHPLTIKIAEILENLKLQ